MDPQLIRLALGASVLLIVFALALRATVGDAASFFRELLEPPHRLVRALAAMYLVVPVVAVTVALTFDLDRPVRAALVAMAIAPVPPILPGKLLRAGGKSDYVFGLLVAISVASIVMVPLCVILLGLAFGREASFGPEAIARLIATTVLAPLIAGLVVAHFAPGVAARIAPWVARLGNLLLLAAAVPVLIVAWPKIVALTGDGAVVAMAAVIAAALAAGHWLGGPAPEERAALAVASAQRHPGIALAIATLNVPEEPRIPAAVILYLLLALAATFLYARSRRTRST